jgi:threonine dehydrogenase-like Zn-dependent dehydrogenase
MSSIPATMKAVVLKEPFNIKIEEVPTPKVEKDTDVVIKVHMAGLCGASTGEMRTDV